MTMKLQSITAVNPAHPLAPHSMYAMIAFAKQAKLVERSLNAGLRASEVVMSPRREESLMIPCISIRGTVAHQIARDTFRSKRTHADCLD